MCLALLSASQGGGVTSGGARVALPRQVWRLVDDNMAYTIVKNGDYQDIGRLRVGVSSIPPAVKAMAAAAVAAGRRVPVALGPPSIGEAASENLTAMTRKQDGMLEINCAPLLRVVHAAAAQAGHPIACILSADPSAGHIRLWLAMPFSTGEDPKTTLPKGVMQLSARALWNSKPPPLIRTRNITATPSGNEANCCAAAAYVFTCAPLSQPPIPPAPRALNI